jgi:hypothetical protein
VKRWTLTRRGELVVALTSNVLLFGPDAEELSPYSSAQHRSYASENVEFHGLLNSFAVIEASRREDGAILS